jgi:hypothetical protein
MTTQIQLITRLTSALEANLKHYESMYGVPINTNSVTHHPTIYHMFKESLEALTEARAAMDAQGEASEFDSPLSDFKEGQWWTLELDAIANSSSATNEQRRAIAVVRHLLRVIAATHPTQTKGEKA